MADQPVAPEQRFAGRPTVADPGAPLTEQYLKVSDSIDVLENKASLLRTKVQELYQRATDENDVVRTKYKTAVNVAKTTFDEKEEKQEEIKEVLSLIETLKAEREELLSQIEELELQVNSDQTIDYSDLSKPQAPLQGGQNAPQPGQDVQNPVHKESHRLNLDNRVAHLRGMIESMRTQLRAIDILEAQLSLAEDTLSELHDERSEQVATELSKILKNDLEVISNTNVHWAKKLEKDVARYVDPRMAAGAALGLIATFNPGGHLSFAAARIALSATGGAMGGDAFAQNLLERSVIGEMKTLQGERYQRVNQDIQAQNEAAHADADPDTQIVDALQEGDIQAEIDKVGTTATVDEIAALVKDYFERGGDEEHIAARIEEIMKKYAKLTYISSVQGLKINAALAELDRKERENNLKNIFVKLGYLLSGGGNKWGRLAAGGLAAGGSALFMMSGGVGGILTALGINAAYTLFKTAPDTVAKTYYEHSAIVQGIEQGIIQYIKDNPDNYIHALNAYGNVEKYRHDAKSYRKQWAFWTGLSFAAVTSAFIGMKDEWFGLAKDQAAAGGPKGTGTTVVSEAAQTTTSTPADTGAPSGGTAEAPVTGGSAPQAEVPATPPADAVEPKAELNAPKTMQLETPGDPGQVLYYEQQSPDGNPASYNLAKEVIKGHIEQVHADPKIPHAAGMEELYGKPFDEKDPVTQAAIKHLEAQWTKENLFTNDGELNKVYLQENHVDLTRDATGGINSHADAKAALEDVSKNIGTGAETAADQVGGKEAVDPAGAENAADAAKTGTEAPNGSETPTPRSDEMRRQGEGIFDGVTFQPPVETGNPAFSDNALFANHQPEQTAQAAFETTSTSASSDSHVIDASDAFAKRAADTGGVLNTGETPVVALNSAVSESPQLAQIRAVLEQVGSQEKSATDIADSVKKDINDHLIDLLAKQDKEVFGLSAHERVNALRSAVLDTNTGGFFDRVMFATPEQKVLQVSDLTNFLEKDDTREAVLSRLTALAQSSHVLKEAA